VNLTLSYNIKGLSINKALKTIMLAKSSFYKIIKMINSADNSMKTSKGNNKSIPMKSKRGRKKSDFTLKLISFDNIDSLNSNNNNQDSYLNFLNIKNISTNPYSIISKNGKDLIISIPNTVVKNDIQELLSKEFVCYGYKKVAKFLKKHIGYIINHKKVYGFMKEMSLLLLKKKPASIGIIRAKNRIIHLIRPNELWQIDIKYLYIHGEKRNAYVCTILDCFTKEAIAFYHGKHCLNENIKALLEEALIKRNIINFSNYQLICGNGGSIERIKNKIKLNLDDFQIYSNSLSNNLTLTIRSDNGSQFSAKNVYNYLLTLSVIGINHERIHVATPEEDGYIESFHSIMHTEFETKYEFDTFEEQRDHLIKWFVFYNNERIHSAIDYCTPNEFYSLYINNIKSLKDQVNTEEKSDSNVNDKINDKNIAIINK